MFCDEPLADPLDVIVDAVVVQHRHLLLDFSGRLATELDVLAPGVYLFLGAVILVWRRER